MLLTMSIAFLPPKYAHIPSHCPPIALTPSRQSIEVPETLLKKRKQTEKSREERLAKAAEAKKVRASTNPPFLCFLCYMMYIFFLTASYSLCCLQTYHLSGLILLIIRHTFDRYTNQLSGVHCQAQGYLQARGGVREGVSG